MTSYAAGNHHSQWAHIINIIIIIIIAIIIIYQIIHSL
jgi:hypothetical protein